MELCFGVRCGFTFSAASRPINTVISQGSMAKAGSRTSRTDADALGDAELVKAWRRGDGHAAEVLVRRHQKAVYRLMLRSTGDPAAADDLMQKAFLKALAKVDHLRGEGAFQAWLLRIALNFAHSRGRGLTRWLRAPAHELDTMRSKAPSPDEALDQEQRLREVRKEIHRLPKRQRQIVEMRLHAELPFKSIAEVVGTSEASAKVTYHNAVRNLRKQLQKRGITGDTPSDSQKAPPPPGGGPRTTRRDGEE